MREALPRRARYALALSTFAALAPALFALVSVTMHARAPEPDPAAVIWSARSSFIDRAIVTGYVTLALAVIAGPVMVKRESITARAFEVSVALSVIAALVGGALWP